MKALPTTPLEPVPRPEGMATGALFFKREDLLPYGGGNKVPRFLRALSRRQPVRRIAAFSDHGSHTFGTLVHFVRDAELGIEGVRLYERPKKTDPYRARIAATYEALDSIQVVRGWQPWLLVRWTLRKLWRRRGELVLRIGGRVPGTADCYRPAVSSCVRQLAAAGAGDDDATHVIPVAGADTARALRAHLDEAGRAGDAVVGMLTGHPAATRLLRLRPPAGVALIEPPAVPWAEYVERAQACHDATGVWLDPAHTLPAWASLPDLPADLVARPIVFWVTCPLIDALPD